MRKANEIKIVRLVKRRADLSLAQFKNYWLTRLFFWRIFAGVIQFHCLSDGSESAKLRKLAVPLAPVLRGEGRVRG